MKHISRVIIGALILFAIPSFAANCTVHNADSPSTIYGCIENLACGETASVEGGVYSMVNNNLPRINIASKSCGSGNPITIIAADPNNKPLFDYTGIPIDQNFRTGTLNASGTSLTWASCTDNPSSLCNIPAFYSYYVGKTITLNGTISCTISAYTDATHITVSGCSPGTLTGATYSIAFNGSSCALIPGTYTPSDCNRGPWQVGTSSYVVIDGIRFRGAVSNTQETVSGLRLNGSHYTVRNCGIEYNWGGLYGNVTDLTIEYCNFIGNGKTDQQHQLYIGNGDNLTVRYNSLDASDCCIQIDGSITHTGGGQNLHLRAWHVDVYGNWIKDGPTYETDCYFPADDSLALTESTDQYCNYYGNIWVTNPAPRTGNAKVVTFLAGPTARVLAVTVANGGSGYTNGDLVTIPACIYSGDGQPYGDGTAKATVTTSGGVVTSATVTVPGNGYYRGTTCSVTGGTGTGLTLTLSIGGTQHIDFQWNTIYDRYSSSTSTGAYPPNNGYMNAIFQINNDSTSTAGNYLHYSNNTLHFVTSTDPGTSWQSLMVLNGNTAPWQITGSNNAFDTGPRIINTCSTLTSGSNGSCLLTSPSSFSQASPPFVNLAGLNLAPNAPGAFGTADTTQTLKSPYVPTSATTLQTVTSWNDNGAIQTSIAPTAPVSFLLF